MINYIAMRLGYVESNTTALLIWKSDMGFKAKEKAIASLARWLKKKYEVEEGRAPTIFAWEYFLKSIMASISVDFGEYESIRDPETSAFWCPWQANPFNISDHNSICIEEKAEEVLWSALVAEEAR